MRTLVAAALLASACGSPAPAAIEAPASLSPPMLLPIGPAAFAKSETLQWKMSVSRVEAGRFWIRGENAGGGAARLVSGSRATGVARFFRRVETRAVTIVDRDSGATRSSLFERNDQGHRARVSLTYDDAGIRGTFGAAETRAHARATAGALKPINTETFLLGLRQWRPERGGRALAAVVAVRDVWLLELEAADVVTMKTAVGERLARVIRGRATHLLPDGEVDPKAKTRRLTLWLSEDADRLPLRVEADTLVGRITVSIVSHETAR